MHQLYNVPEIRPQGVGVAVVLVNGHIIFNVAVVYPFKGGFKVVLPNGRAVHVIFRKPVSGAVILAEVGFRARKPFARVGGVSQFLIGKFFAGDVYYAEPGEFFLVVALAEVHQHLVIEYSVLLRFGKVAKLPFVYRIIVIHVLAETYRSLLAVKHFEGAVLVFHPVHNVQRKALVYGIDNGVAFFVVVNELPLILRADIQSAAVTDNAFLVVIQVTVHYFPYSYLVKFNFHFLFSLLKVFDKL